MQVVAGPGVTLGPATARGLLRELDQPGPGAVDLRIAGIRGEIVPDDRVHRGVLLHRSHPSALQDLVIDGEGQVRHAPSVALIPCSTYACSYFSAYLKIF